MMKKDHFKLKLLPRPQFPFNSLSANPTEWSNTLKTIRRQFPDKLFECFWPFCRIDT